MSLQKVLKKAQGFTLIELLVVIVIIGILAATIVPKIMGAPAKARDTGRIAQLNTVALALGMYYNDNGQYPATTGCLDPAATSGTAFDLISGGYLGQSDFPVDTTTSNVVGSCTGQFLYEVLTSKGVAKNAFVLWTNPESDAVGNAVDTCIGKTALKDTDACINTGVGTSIENANIFGKLSF